MISPTASSTVEEPLCEWETAGSARESIISGDKWLLLVPQHGVCGGVRGRLVPSCADMH